MGSSRPLLLNETLIWISSFFDPAAVHGDPQENPKGLSLKLTVEISFYNHWSAQETGENSLLKWKNLQASMLFHISELI